MNSQKLFLHVVYDGQVFGMGMVFSADGRFLHAASADAVRQIRRLAADGSSASARYHILDPLTSQEFSDPLSRAAVDRFNVYFMELFRKGSPASDSYTLFGGEIQGVLSRFAHGAETIVDYGCGHRSYEPILREYASNVISVDIDPRIESRAGQTREGMSSESRFESVNPPLQPGCADLVLCAFVLEHVASPAILVAGFSSLLKSGGTLVLAIPSLDCLQTLQMLLRRGKMTLPLNHLRTFGIISSGFCESLHAVIMRLKRTGFSIVQTIGINPFPPTSTFARKFNLCIRRLFPFKYLGAQTIIVAAKT